MIPVALKTYLPGGNDSQVYAFDDVVINDPMGWRGIFGRSLPGLHALVVEEGCRAAGIAGPSQPGASDRTVKIRRKAEGE